MSRMTLILLALSIVISVIPSTRIAADDNLQENQCGIPKDVTNVSGDYSDSLYHFTHVSWHETKSEDKLTIGYCIALQGDASTPVWFDWPRARRLKGYTNKRTRRIRTSNDYLFPPANEPQSPMTRLWYGAKPKQMKAELFDFNGMDDDFAQVESDELPSFHHPFAGSALALNRPLPRLESASEFSVPRTAASDRPDADNFVDVSLRFESTVSKLASEDAETTWLYVYRWENISPPETQMSSRVLMGRLQFPPIFLEILSNQRREGRLPRQDAEWNLYSNTEEAVSFATIAFLTKSHPDFRVSTVRILDSEQRQVVAQVPVSMYFPERP